MFCYLTIVAYSQGWGAPMFQRTWGWEPAQYATINAIVLLTTGPLAVNVAGWWSDRSTASGVVDAPLRIAFIGVLITLTTGVAAPLMPGPYLAIGVYGLNTIGIAFISAVGVTALINIAPANMRAQIIAFYYTCISLAGLLLGPTSIALLNDHVFGTDGIRYSMALLPLVYGAPILLARGVILRRYREALLPQEGEGAPA